MNPKQQPAISNKYSIGMIFNKNKKKNEQTIDYF
jgi:hypothetical protein